jgi:sugar/nucleoside kinase (ribokinase family)
MGKTPERRDIVVYGHYTHDVIISGSHEEHRLGGPPAYISELLDALGADYEVVSKVGRDFKYHDRVYREPKVSSKPTTCFINIYSGAERLQKNPSVCEHIFPKDVIPAKVAIVTGVIGEVLPETIHEIRSQSELVIVDVQSLIRRRNSDGSITEVPLEKTAYVDAVREADFITSNEKEFACIDRKKLGPVVILTQGKHGCTIMEKDKSTVVPTTPINEGDPTGCGDMFVGGFAYALLKELGLKECAAAANRCGALALRGIGVPNIKEEWISEVF